MNRIQVSLVSKGRFIAVLINVKEDGFEENEAFAYGTSASNAMSNLTSLAGVEQFLDGSCPSHELFYAIRHQVRSDAGLSPY